MRAGHEAAARRRASASCSRCARTWNAGARPKISAGGDGDQKRERRRRSPSMRTLLEARNASRRESQQQVERPGADDEAGGAAGERRGRGSRSASGARGGRGRRRAPSGWSISRVRPAARTSSRLPTFAHAISSTQPTADRSSSSAGRADGDHGVLQRHDGEVGAAIAVGVRLLRAAARSRRAPSRARSTLTPGVQPRDDVEDSVLTVFLRPESRDSAAACATAAAAPTVPCRRRESRMPAASRRRSASACRRASSRGRSRSGRRRSAAATVRGRAPPLALAPGHVVVLRRARRPTSGSTPRTLEQIVRAGGREHLLGIAAVAGEVDARAPVRRDAGKRARLFLRDRSSSAARSSAARCVVRSRCDDAHERGGTRIVERPEQNGIHDAEDRAVGADRQPEDRQDDDREQRLRQIPRTAIRTSCRNELMGAPWTWPTIARTRRAEVESEASGSGIAILPGAAYIRWRKPHDHQGI